MVTFVSMKAASACFPELLESFLEKLGSWLVMEMPRDKKLLLVHGQQPIAKHRAVYLFKDV